MSHRILLLTLVAAVAARNPLALGNEPPPIWETEIQPLLAMRCGKCHGQQLQRGDLDLSTLTAVRKGGESGEPLIGDSLDNSLLWTMISGASMPPQEEPPLSEHEKLLIQRWIEAGAPTKIPEPQAPQLIHQHDVIPILLLRCTTCHGARRTDGGLDLRTVAAMKRGGHSGPAFVAGQPADSLMIQRIERGQCPPSELLLQFFVQLPERSEIDTLRKWIAAGAPEVDVQPDVAGTVPDPLVTDEDRRHWAFQPPQAPHGSWSVDQLIEARLAEAGLTFSPEADRDTLIRRAYLDLTGLPPGRDEWRTWRHAEGPDWFESMIEILLHSPHYGERWGRYWLDVAGYADSEGGVSADPVRPVAWKYRDYVIDAFNQDLPYDEFLTEQIAGDELVDVESAPEVTDEMVRRIVATGFLRMGIDQTGSRTMNFVPERLGVINDAITVLGSGVMGLTLECARCHSHKYDPIPQRDYYRFKAIFQGALDEHDWLTFKTRTLDVATPKHRRQYAEQNPPLQKELRRLEAELRQATADWQSALLRTHYPLQSEADRAETLKALRIADNVRTQPQRLLVEKLRQAELLPDSHQPVEVLEASAAVQQIEDAIADLQRRLVPPATVRALWDRGDPSPTWILLRGEHHRPGRLTGPGVPSALTDGMTPFVVTPPFPSGTPKTGRRLAFAKWLTHPNHPLTARVMVNRIWKHHFGAGLVSTLEDFGRNGAPPSHPELLDALAVEFMKSGWSIGHMHRVMMNSRTWRQSSRVTDEQLARDPAGRLLSRMPLRRMDAECLHDSLLFVSGRLDVRPGGPPDPVSVDRDGLAMVRPTEHRNWRRAIYARYRRTELPSLVQVFDYPEMGPNCVARTTSTIAPQALMLMNSAQIRELSESLARDVMSIAEGVGESRPEQLVTVVCQIALSREPNEFELAAGVQAISDLMAAGDGNELPALTTYCHTVLNSAAFLYID